MTLPTPWRFLVGSLMAAALLVPAGGCARSGKHYVPARGQVLVGGLPAEGAQITLVPVGGGDDPDLKPSGTVGADGRFALSTYEVAAHKVRDGAPPGQYVVLLSWAPQPSRESLARPAADPDRLDRRYRDARTSPLRAEVAATATDLPPIQLGQSDLSGRRR